MDKLLVDRTGDGIVTNNGASILREMVEHPVGNIISDLAVSHEEGVRDGTTTTAILTGELLGQADTLIDDDIHPTTLANGYLEAAGHAVELVEDRAIEIDASDADRLVEIATTSMAGKGTITEGTDVPALVVEAVQRVATDEGVDLDNVRVEKVDGPQVGDSTLMEGVVVDKERADASFSYRVEDATIAIVDKDIELRELGKEGDVGISSPADVTRIRDDQRSEAVAIVDHLAELDVDAVVCGQNIAEIPRGLMAERGMYATRRVHDDDLAILAEATGANVVAEARELDEADLGHAGFVEETDIGGERKTLVDDCASDTTATLVLYGSTKGVVDELHRAVKDALSVVAAAVDKARVVPGGGAVETAAALELREFATQYDTREQIAIEAFADAIDAIPRTLAENADINPIDGVVNVRAEQSTGTQTAGLDGETGDVVDVVEAGIVEPLSVKTRAFETAAEAAIAILRIDGMLPRRESAGTDEEMAGEEPAGGMGAGGMGGM